MRRILHIEHDWGGGLGRHVRDLASFLESEGIESLRCRPSRTAWLDIETVNNPYSSQSARLFPDDIERCVATFRDLNIVHAHIHSIINYSPFVIDQLLCVLQHARLKYDCTLHDYSAICPRVHMVDLGQIYCDVASLRYCDRCVSTASTPFGAVDPAVWRERHLRLLQGARSIFVPTIDVAERHWAYLGDELRFKVRPHPEPISIIPTQSVRRLPDATRARRVAIIGRLTGIKGLHVVRAMALDAAKRNLPLRFVLFGEPETDDLRAFSNVDVKGTFEEHDIDALIRDHPTDLAFFPSVCPETHLYTLSIAIRNLLFPVVFNVGSQAERVKRTRYGAVLPLDMALTPDRLNDQLMAMNTASTSAREVNARQPIASWSSAREYYELSGL